MLNPCAENISLSTPSRNNFITFSMEKNNDTIFALSTLEGKSGIAVIRISGQASVNAFKLFGIKNKPEPRLATLVKLTRRDTGECLDNALCLWFPSPASFTGEDVVELHLHGSRAVIRETLNLLGNLEGFRMAAPGEFSLRAFENGKMDLTALEGLADLIDAETVLQQRQAMRQMSGELSNLYEDWRRQILSILAKTEAYIDFPDEDLPMELVEEFSRQIDKLYGSITMHLSDRRGQIIREGFHAVILGAPNVGKSSLLNYLAKRDVAIVSEIAGTTRDIIEVHMDLDGYPLTVSDTAGIRKSEEAIEKEGISRALDRAKNADFKIVMLDSSTKDIAAETLRLIDDKTILAVNKSDLGQPSFDNSQLDLEPMLVSIKTGQGMDALIERVGELLKDSFTPSTSPLFTRERHRKCLEISLAGLKKFKSLISAGSPIELCAEELRAAANALGQITGKIDVEELLGEIFSSFCIGK